MSSSLRSFKDAVMGFTQGRFYSTPLWTHEIPCINTPEKREEFLGSLKVVRFAMNEGEQQQLIARDALHLARTALNNSGSLEWDVMKVAVSAFDPEWIFAGQPKNVVRALAGCVGVSRRFCTDFAELEQRYDAWAG